jgi:ABC-type multidrug transport system fused ATPase/permease subunit
MEISEVLSQAWKVIWRHKVLWIFGILAGCSGTGRGGGNFQWTTSSGELPPNLQQFFARFGTLTEAQIAMLVVALVILFILLVLFALFLGTFGRIGLIRGTQEADQGVQRLTFGGLFQRSTPYFWRIFGLNLLLGLIIFLVLILMLVFVMFSAIATMGIAVLCFFPFLCVLIPLGWLLAVIIEQANLAIILEDLDILSGIRRGWEVFRQNLGPIILMALILMIGIGFIGGLIISIPIFFVIIPIVMGGMMGTSQSYQSGFLVAGLCFLAYLPVLILLSGILRSYIESAWTLTYLRLTKRSLALAGEV